MAYVLDIGVILIFVATIFAGYRHGFLRSVIGVVGFVAALVLAFSLSGVLADGAYTAFVKNPTEKAISATVNDITAGPSASLEENLKKAEEELPGFVKGMIEKSGTTLTELSQKVEGGIENTADAIAVTVTEQVVKPAMTLLLRCILFIVLFVLLLLAAKILERLLGKIIKHTPFKKLDKLLGAVLGALKGCLWVLLVVTVMQMIAGFTADTALISEKSISQTAVVSKVAEWNPIYSDNNVVIQQFNALFGE
jgi:uncharacterized membrane protein required for colicin V production